MTSEHERLRDVPRGRAPWRHWGPYPSRREAAPSLPPETSG